MLTVQGTETYLLKTDEKFASTAKTIKETDCLVIDEVSMVSKRVFETIEYVCRQLKEPTQVFGGMQVILSGDSFSCHLLKIYCMVTMGTTASMRVSSPGCFPTLSYYPTFRDNWNQT